MGLELEIEQLTASGFSSFGEVIETGAQSKTINAGSASSFTDLAKVDVSENGGELSVNIYQAARREFPLEVKLVERHPLGSQAFIPMAGQRFLVIVCEKIEQPLAKNLKAFITNGKQGVNLTKGVWHHPFIAIDGGDFLVIDRKGAGENCQEFYFDDDICVKNII